jgi:hypothetical protein
MLKDLIDCCRFLLVCQEEKSVSGVTLAKKSLFLSLLVITAFGFLVVLLIAGFDILSRLASSVAYGAIGGVRTVGLVSSLPVM